MHRGSGWFAVFFLAAEAYAVLRYHLFGSTPWSDLLFYTTNKALAISSAVALSAVLALRPLAVLGWQVPSALMAARPDLGRLALVAACIHAFLSYGLLGPEYYPKFYASGLSLNAIGRWSLLFGWISMALYWLYHLHRQRSGNSRTQISLLSQLTGFVLLSMIALHTVVMGFRAWLSPESWPGALPPISLLSAVFLVAGAVAVGSATFRSR